MEGVDRLLGSLDVAAESFETAEASADRSIRRAAGRAACAIYVLSGQGRLCLADREAIDLPSDAFAIVPIGEALTVESVAPHDAPLVVALGRVHATVAGAAGLFDALDAPIVHRFASTALRENFRMLAEELAAPSVGSQALADGVLRQALILLIRRRCDAAGAVCPWIVAMREPRLLPALSVMLERPADPLSLDALARMAGMSRSVFSGRFAAAFGSTPIEFLKRIRLGEAARLLSTTDLPVKKIARVVGYESRSYFSRAFRARYALDPSDYRSRRAGRAAPTPCS